MIRATSGGWAKRILLLTAVAVLVTVFAKTRSGPANTPVAEAPPSDVTRPRTIAFDNLYGDSKSLLTHVRVDGGPEQTLTATCTDAACTFELPLTDARHEVLVAVEQDGRRSQPTRVTLDTGAAR